MRRSSHSVRRPIKFVKSGFKQLIHIIKYKLKYVINRKNAPVPFPVYFYPELPHPYTVCYKVLHSLGVLMKKGLPPKNSKAIIFVWQDDTFVSVESTDFWVNNWTLINNECVDISKQKVDQLHAQVFNYSLTVDPLHYQGLIVIKSNMNGAHDGIEVMAPLQNIEGNAVYQRIVRNYPLEVPQLLTNEGEVVYDIRVVIFDSTPKFAYLKYRAKSHRFSNTNLMTCLIEISQVISKEESETISRFCQEVGLAYGEVDVVRDAGEGKIYILDVNKTPLGPPNGLSNADYELAMRQYIACFIDLLVHK